MKLKSIGKKGITITTPTLVVVILSILVLLVLVLTFGGGMANLVDKIKEIYYRQAPVSQDVAVEMCNTWCQTGAKKAFCTPLDVVGKDTQENCEDILGKTCSGICCNNPPTFKCPETSE